MVVPSPFLGAINNRLADTFTLRISRNYSSPSSYRLQCTRDSLRDSGLDRYNLWIQPQDLDSKDTNITRSSADDY